MEIGAKSPGVTLADVQQAARDAAASMVPPFASTIPRAEMTGGAAGTAAAVPRADHQHPRLTATATGTLAADGTASVTFTRTFEIKPAVTVLEIDSGGNSNPVDFKVRAWKTDASGLYTGCTIYGSRARTLPTLTPMNAGLLTLLSAVVNATNALFAQLSGYAPFEAAGGAAFSLIALQPSPPPAT